MTNEQQTVEQMPGMVSLGFRTESGPWQVSFQGRRLSGPYHSYADAERTLSRWKREYGTHARIEEVR